MDILQTILTSIDILSSIKKIVPFEKHRIRLDEIDQYISNPDIWNDAKQATILLKERQKISDLLNKYQRLYDSISFYKECQESIGLSNDEQKIVQNLYNEIYEFEFQQMMSDPASDSPAILTINAGAGGLEAANWVTMLLRMYVRWADNYKFKIEYLDMKPSEEHSSICTDSVSVRIDGKYAYGFLKGENGVHRLIRNSPFNAGDARHTSFAAVSVVPDIEDKIDIKIDEKDIDIVAQTAGTKGGQNANKVCSAIRLRHFPTGINIFVRTERDQLSNKKTAYKLLKAKLYEIEKKKKQSEQDKFIDAQMENKFGSQIRTYTLSPYTLIKDHRTEHENTNAQSVLDGNIQSFLLSNLKMNT